MTRKVGTACDASLDGRHHFEVRKIDQLGGTERRCHCGRTPNTRQENAALEGERATQEELKKQKGQALRFTSSNAPKEQGRL